MKHLERLHNYYINHERIASSVFLVFGFVFNILTLKRVDLFWENFWIIAHIVIVGVLIFLIQYEEKRGEEKSRMHFWYLSAMQFLFGGIFSTYLVFYFRSGDLFASLPFYLLLAIAFAANESFKKHSARLGFQIAMFFMSVYMFAIFILPVITHKISSLIFILSGVLSVIVVGVFTEILFRFVVKKEKKFRHQLSGIIIGIFIVVNGLYFSNLIPPIPFSMRDGGVYHQVSRAEDGSYRIVDESRSWVDDMTLYQLIHVTNNPVYAFSAIFSPPGFMTEVVHEWQSYDKKKNEWITKSTIHLPVIGGREGGFRTYSRINSITPGLWRVNIETPDGHTIDRIRIRAIESYPIPPLKEIKK